MVIADRALLGVGPHCPPQARMGVRFPHRLGLETLVPLVPMDTGTPGVGKVGLGGWLGE